MKRLGTAVLVAAFVALRVLEHRRPRRVRGDPKRARVNVIASVPAGLVARLGVAPALAAMSDRRGLLSPLPAPLRFVAGFIALDAANYVWHRLNHEVDVLWRFHRAHHADRELDVTTALRFHPVEVALSIPFFATVVALTGAPRSSVIAYEAAMQLAVLLHHSNVAFTHDAAMRSIFVTPHMHEIHHSTRGDEQCSNWSVVFSFWDRVAGTYTEQHREPLEIGLPQ